jgi:pyridoxine kinase
MRAANPDLVYFCDPVMGDNGKLYVPESLVDIYREQVLPVATVVTPNQFECELLTGIKIECEADARRACMALHSKGPDSVILTSLDWGKSNNSTTDENNSGPITMFASQRRRRRRRQLHRGGAWDRRQRLRYRRLPASRQAQLEPL